MTTIVDNPSTFKIRPRWRWQFSLRTLLLFVVYCSVLLGLFVWARKRIQEEQSKVQAIQKELAVQKALLWLEKHRSEGWSIPAAPAPNDGQQTGVPSNEVYGDSD